MYDLFVSNPSNLVVSRIDMQGAGSRDITGVYRINGYIFDQIVFELVTYNTFTSRFTAVTDTKIAHIADMDQNVSTGSTVRFLAIQVGNDGTATSIGPSTWDLLATCTQETTETSTPLFSNVNLGDPTSHVTFGGLESLTDARILHVPDADTYIPTLTVSGASSITEAGSVVPQGAWSHMSTLDQGLSTTDSPTFSGLAVGMVNVDVSAAATASSVVFREGDTNIPVMTSVIANAIEQSSWSHLSTVDQGLSTSSSPTFSNINTSTLTVDSRTLASDRTSLDAHVALLAGLTAVEVNQIKNIDTTDIAADKWEHVASMQAVGTTDAPVFDNIRIESSTLNQAQLRVLSKTGGTSSIKFYPQDQSENSNAAEIRYTHSSSSSGYHLAVITRGDDTVLSYFDSVGFTCSGAVKGTEVNTRSWQSISLDVSGPSYTGGVQPAVGAYKILDTMAHLWLSDFQRQADSANQNAVLTLDALPVEIRPSSTLRFVVPGFFENASSVNEPVQIHATVQANGMVTMKVWKSDASAISGLSPQALFGYGSFRSEGYYECILTWRV